MKKKKTNLNLIIALLICLLLPISRVSADTQIPQADLKSSIEYQEIDGFGVSQSADVYADQIYEHNKRDELMDLLFSDENGIGLSILRSEVGNGLNMPTIHPDINTWDFTAYQPEQWVMHEAKNRGVETFMSTVWSPPAWMKTNNRITRGGKLKREYYGEYAQYLAEYVKGYNLYHDIKIDAISIANEPEYAASWQSNLWSGEDFRLFVKDYLKPTFERENLDTKIIVGEEATFSDKRLKSIYSDQQALDSVDIIGTHYYHGKPYVFEQAKYNGKKVWVTETSETILSDTGFKDGVNWSKNIHDTLTKADANAFVFWLGAAYKNNNESLIRLTDKNNYIDAKRLYSMGNYSKFIKPGFKRIGVTENPTGNLYLSAYKDENTGDIVIVAVNNGQNNESIDLTFDDIDMQKLTPYVTNSKYNLEKLPDLIVNDRSVRLNVSGYTTATFVGNIFDQISEESIDYRIDDNLDDWSKISYRSDNWYLDSHNPYNGFDHDYSRARRTKKTSEYIVYKLDDLTDFRASIYYYKVLDGLRFEVSEDGENWEQVDYQYDSPRLTGGYWEYINVYPSNQLPEGTNYLKIIFEQGDRRWDKQLSSIKIN